MPLITTDDGCRINVEISGSDSAPALMLSNSLGTNLHMWDDQVGEWARHFRVIRYDRRGHGGSEAPAGPYSMERLGRDVLSILDKLGIDYVEGGYPGANPLDTTFFAEKRTKSAKFTAFGMTKRAGRSVSNDPGVAALLEAQADAICFVAKSWDYHVRVALETTPEEHLAGIRESVEAARAKGREVLVDCEHFFDGYKANPDYALSCVTTA